MKSLADLCWVNSDGVYIDVVRSDIDQTWTVFLDNERIQEGIATRDEAVAVAWPLNELSALTPPLNTPNINLCDGCHCTIMCSQCDEWPSLPCSDMCDQCI